jgi:Na+-transporting NADH:ubiquinone oxidoreductase subunit F
MMLISSILIPILVLSSIVLMLSFFILSAKQLLVSREDCEICINESKREKVASGGTLLENLLKLGYGIASPCGGKATCHQCKVQIVEGGADPLDIETMIFSPKKIKQGWRLSCQCKVKGCLKIHLSPSSLNVAKFKAKVLSNDNVSTFIKELCVKVPERININYIPGDYMQVHIPVFTTDTDNWKERIGKQFQNDWEKFKLFGKKMGFKEEDQMRAYSLASYPEEGKVLKFTVRIATPPFYQGVVHPKISWGIGSTYLFSLKEGDELELSGPYGESHMIENDKELIFLIGGAGASFARSHILDLFLNKKTKRKVSLWYGARSLKENIYQQEFENLAKTNQNFFYHLVLSEPEEKDIEAGWPKGDPLKTGFACNAFIKGQLEGMEAPENALYYVCGPPMHNKMVLKALADFGVESDSIVLDDFGN